MPPTSMPKTKKPVWTPEKKTLVKDLFHFWLERFHILPSEIVYDWQDLDNKDDDEESGAVHFEVTSSFPYRSIRLTCFPAAAECDEETLTRYLLHEAVHCVLAPINKARYEPWPMYRQFGEFVTENLTHYIWSCRMYDDEKDEKIKALEAEIRRLKKRRR